MNASDSPDFARSTARPPLSVVVPVYNEATTIEALLRSIVDEFSSFVAPTIVVCVDPGADETLAVVQRLSTRLPIVINTAPQRRGYARAVLEGLQRVQSEFVLVMDGDSQCDPRDFQRLWEARAADLVIGQRTPRRDPLARRILSTGFRYLYSWTLGVTVIDPSCPYLLFRLEPMRASLAEASIMWGLWWEVVARAHWHGVSIAEVPIRHRARPSGPSRALPVSRLALASMEQLWGLVRLRRELVHRTP